MLEDALGFKCYSMQGVKINSRDSTDTETMLLSLNFSRAAVAGQMLLVHLGELLVQHLGRNTGFHPCPVVLWELVEHLLQSARGRGDFRKMLTAA